MLLRSYWFLVFFHAKLEKFMYFHENNSIPCLSLCSEPRGHTHTHGKCKPRKMAKVRAFYRDCTLRISKMSFYESFWLKNGKSFYVVWLWTCLAFERGYWRVLMKHRRFRIVNVHISHPWTQYF